ALGWVKQNCAEAADINAAAQQRSRAQKDADWEFVVKMTMIGRDLMVGNPRLAELGYGEEALGHNAIASGFQGQRQWTDHFPNGDFMETMLNTSFDWNGIREAFVCATENDYLNGISMLFGHQLTGTAQIFSDVRTFWSPAAVKRVTGKSLAGEAQGGIIHLINSGSTTMDGTGRMSRSGKPALKPYWEITPDEAAACLEATHFCPADVGYFRGGGFSSEFETRGGMPVTMARLNMAAGLGPVLQIAEGSTVDLPKEVAAQLEQRTNPTWPTTWFVPRVTGAGAFRDVYSVMNNWGANHGAISSGHIGADLIALASILRIPVSMHNVPPERIFRPKCWASFGDAESESADYRACAALGPLYGK
ncbi:MAG: L-fucose isomerase, partial [Spirochaetia bacterium]